MLRPRLSRTGRCGAGAFLAAFRREILLAWIIPAIFGLSFLVYIRMFSPAEMARILLTPLEPLFVFLAVAGAAGYFRLYARPLVRYLEKGDDVAAAMRAITRFPLHFWGTFVGYLLLAPASVILAAERYTDYVATPLDWFRIHLVALIVSIIVGLPIFFRIMDLLGRHFGSLPWARAPLGMRVKVFLIGALVPLLIDTMLVQYYWSRTGYFSAETFGVWLFLELLAVAGSLFFAHSFGQALAPLQGLLAQEAPEARDIEPRSLDELGLLAARSREMLERLQVDREVLALSNRILRVSGRAGSTGELLERIVEICAQGLDTDLCFLLLHDPGRDDLVGVVQTGAPYREQGHYRLSLREVSLAVRVFRRGSIETVEDAGNDPRVSPRMVRLFGIRSAIAAPLQVGQETIGVLIGTDTRRSRSFGERERALIGALAREAATAVHTARLEERRRQAEAARREHQALAERLMSAVAEGVCGIDRAGRCTFANPAALALLGRDGDDSIVGSDLHGLVHPGEDPGAPCPLALALQEGRAVEGDAAVFVRADGAPFDVEFRLRPVSEDGERAGAVLTFSDVTGRRAVEAALRHQHALVRRLLDATLDGYVLADLEGRIRDVNPAYCELLGYSRQELLEMSVFGLESELTPAQIRTRVADFQAAGRARFETTHRSRSGAPIPVEVSITVIGESGGEPLVAAFVRDIRARRESERLMREHQRELERQVAERTSELAAANRELEAFAYSVSHDLRAPLRAIDGFGHALVEDFGAALPAEARSYIERIRSASQRMGTLIDDLLSLSRIQRAPLVREEVDLAAIAREVAGHLAAREPGRQVRWEIPEELPAAADPGLVRIALENLLGNAWKYTRGRPEAVVRVGLRETDGERVFMVADNGPGFDPRYAGKIFEPFHRLHGHDEFEGTGIGLATVARVVARHGGRIWVEARPGEGATFLFTLAPPRKAAPRP